MKGHEVLFYLPIFVTLGICFLLPLINKKFRARLSRDPVMAFMYGVAFMLEIALLFFAVIAGRTHNFEILKILLLATGAFSIVGIVFGLVHSLRGKPSA